MHSHKSELLGGHTAFHTQSTQFVPTTTSCVLTTPSSTWLPVNTNSYHRIAEDFLISSIQPREQREQLSKPDFERINAFA